MCARNSDGTGTVFDLVNIIPWLKCVLVPLSGKAGGGTFEFISRYRQHDNTHPVTKEPLKPEYLIKLNYSRKATGEYHDPISFKPFSEHSHIVAIATTGNVYLAESIKGGKDLLDDVKFKRYAHGHVVHASPTDESQRGCHYLAEPTWNATGVRSVNINKGCGSTGQ